MHCITGKTFVEIESILGSVPWKTTQGRSKFIAKLIFEGLKNKNEKCYLQETYLDYVNLWGPSFGAKPGA